MREISYLREVKLKTFMNTNFKKELTRVLLGKKMAFLQT